ncbi:hypothetical protein PRIPAC_89982 [Pristionchus pacificus]|uniref:Uncharacterized protein n=1 Tax=Pristionchus pacificus TaxID=54126 RepID=A0A2A6B9D5_PRIPA|nr:hypothetical protein PRIPAC_89982 [Pristionchus pacificus]|eukprot:PDM62471.1 hypothetical protein PRIPAC_51913 [Pristionchus pacificus]
MFILLLLVSIAPTTTTLECYFQTDVKPLSRRICGSNMTNCMKLEHYPRRIYLGCADEEACSKGKESTVCKYTACTQQSCCKGHLCNTSNSQCVQATLISIVAFFMRSQFH